MNLVSIECPICHNMFPVDPALAGQRMDCPQCRGTIQVPPLEALTAADLPQPPPPPIAAPPPVEPPVAHSSWTSPLRTPVPVELMSVGCPGCGNSFQVPPAAAGLALACPACGKMVTVPAVESPGSIPAPAPPPAADPIRAKVTELLLPPAIDLPDANPTLLAGPSQPQSRAEDDPAARRSARAQQRMIRNIVLWTIGLAVLLAAVVVLTR